MPSVPGVARWRSARANAARRKTIDGDGAESARRGANRRMSIQLEKPPRVVNRLSVKARAKRKFCGPVRRTLSVDAEAAVDLGGDLLEAMAEGVLAQRALKRVLADLARLVGMGEVVVEVSSQLMGVS